MTEKKHLFDNPQNVQRLLRIFYTCCGLLFALDLLVHRHTQHPLETIPGFYALYGLSACVILVVVAKEMRKIVMRSENYYQESSGNKPVHDDPHHEH